MSSGQVGAPNKQLCGIKMGCTGVYKVGSGRERLELKTKRGAQEALSIAHDCRGRQGFLGG